MKQPTRVVAICFVVAIVGALGAAGVYFAGGQPQLEGTFLALALGGVGAGLIVWAKELMAGIKDKTEDRGHGPLSEQDTGAAADTILEGVQDIQRRKLLSRLLLGAGAALGLAAIVPIRSLGQAPGDSLFVTPWRKGMRLVDEEGNIVTRDTVEPGSFATVFPEGHVGSADGQAVLINVGSVKLDLPADRLAGAPEGLVVYSKVCTHAGCPIGLYLAAEHELRCPCHQSTFDVLDGATPVYGPAPRPLPQLLIEIASDGTLVAQGEFTGPIGPSFWDLP
ncbi:MAG: Rieske (2Fe-2S) protein [Actinomycetota bacterium]